jgi:mannose/cellobiose epimerase-like protein (N-acyl-D-glucosamine 2-epimerase family)
LSFIENHMHDSEHGEWYGRLAPDGQLRRPPGDDKGWEWKASYHNLRALVLTSDRIARRLGETG